MPTAAYNQILLMCDSPSEKISTMAKVLISDITSMEEKLIAWHTAMGAPVRNTVSVLPIMDVERRLRLTLEEYRETVEASGFTIISKETGKDIFNDLKLSPLPHGEQDLIEIPDGIGDQLVVNIGHAVEHGYPITAVFNEIMRSNGTKLPIDGIALANKCTIDHSCDDQPEDCVLINPNDPIGKIIKPKSYIKADIASVLAEHEDRVHEKNL